MERFIHSLKQFKYAYPVKLKTNLNDGNGSQTKNVVDKKALILEKLNFYHAFPSRAHYRVQVQTVYISA